jgi:putative ATPase
MDDLFTTSSAEATAAPHADTPGRGRVSLAERLRPRDFDEVLGQDELLAPGTPFRRRVDADRIGAMILYGPPGTSKTTIARIVGQRTGRDFVVVDGTAATAKDLRALMQRAAIRHLLLFIDEFHRVTIPRQEEFLKIIEDGTIQLIAATTGNPYHDIAPGIVSRATIYRVRPLAEDAQARLFQRALRWVAEHEGVHVEADADRMSDFVRRAGGDGRRLITAFENLTINRPHGTRIALTAHEIGQSYDQAAVNYDKGGDQHYDVVSAFIKSMRGSDTDATLFWLARLIQAGEPPEYIARRILIHASEDVGLADNSCLQTATSALQAVLHVGYPEAQIVLAHAALHVARAPKSNSAHRGIGLAMQLAAARPDIQVPPHLRDGHYAGARKLGHTGYAYPHADPRGWVEQVYLPEVPPGTLYQSDARDQQTYEGRADAYWARIRGQGRHHES